MEKPNNEPHSNKKRNILLTTLAIFVIVVVGLAGTDYGDNLRSRILEEATSETSEDRPKTSVCMTKECVDLGQRISAMMDPNVDPCDDFFESVCGNYKSPFFLPDEVRNHALEDRNNIMKFYRKYQPETKSEKVAMVFVEKCMTTQKDLDIDQSIWKSNDLTDLLIEMAGIGPIDTGFIKNHISLFPHEGRIILLLTLREGIEQGSVLGKFLNLTKQLNEHLEKPDMVYILDASKDLKFIDLQKYAEHLLPEENRAELAAWPLVVLRNEIRLLEEVVEAVGVEQIKKFLYEKWRKKLGGFLVKSKGSYYDCFEKAEKLFPGTLAMIFVKNFVKSTNVEMSNELFEHLRVAFDEMFEENTWMDESLKNDLRRELRAMKSSIGVPDEHKDLNNIDRMYARVEKEQKVEDQSYLTLVRNLLKMNSEETFLRVARAETVTYQGETLSINANYYGGSHRISIAPIFLNFPYIDKNLPEWNTISSLGYIIGHEIGHAFDAKFFFYNQGFQEVPMSKVMKNEFDKRINCITNKYDKFQFPDGSFSNGVHTKQEDSADMIGFNLAYRLFKKLEKKQQKLPGLEKYTVEQNYFQRMAYVWCGQSLDKDRIKTQKKDVHSATKFRINGMMSNSKEFARAFKCEKGSPMNPEKKCPLFK